MSKIYDNILINSAAGRKMLAILLDPDKCVGEVLENTLAQLKSCSPDFIFIGGSFTNRSSEELLNNLSTSVVPKILFPGDASQFTPRADALLFLSLLSGRNTDYLIGQHVRSAEEIKKSGIEVIPTAYLLIDGGKKSAVEQVSQTKPIDADDINTCVSTAIAGELLGMKMIYLEAGSGALNTVSTSMIKAVKNSLNVPLIVGGGIKSTNQLKNVLDAGADLVVVGNVFETETNKISDFVNFVKNY